MSINRHRTIKQQCGTCPVDNCCKDESTCLRGLERLLPGGKQLTKQRQKVIRSIVIMFRQMQTITPQEDGEPRISDERELVLSAYCVSKTRYAQHNANYLGAKDAADVLEDHCCCKESLKSTSALSSKQRVVTLSTVSGRRSPVHRAVPMRAMTA